MQAPSIHRNKCYYQGLLNCFQGAIFTLHFLGTFLKYNSSQLLKEKETRGPSNEHVHSAYSFEHMNVVRAPEIVFALKRLQLDHVHARTASIIAEGNKNFRMMKNCCNPSKTGRQYKGGLPSPQ